jgi:hypothetical protein
VLCADTGPDGARLQHVAASARRHDMDALLLHQSDVEELLTIDRITAVTRRLASLIQCVLDSYNGLELRCVQGRENHRPCAAAGTAT